ncbi:hypothetical protein EH240_18840 [Mesorhizobium tamadayense]|uniref:Uncharacterized protein n=1 Tax=Mesorhizobium tamadayense TaxID=425306 RepID=A0A3P3FJH2_9HYPH|nr:hypothetical protein [Mesorhizobium tamadayense]RRH98805.1 hypothetical protein EH240_18840 [Mesorhizobium tamadayense]
MRGNFGRLLPQDGFRLAPARYTGPPASWRSFAPADPAAATKMLILQQKTPKWAWMRRQGSRSPVD